MLYFVVFVHPATFFRSGFKLWCSPDFYMFIGFLYYVYVFLVRFCLLARLIKVKCPRFSPFNLLGVNLLRLFRNWHFFTFFLKTELFLFTETFPDVVQRRMRPLIVPQRKWSALFAESSPSFLLWLGIWSWSFPVISTCGGALMDFVCRELCHGCTYFCFSLLLFQYFCPELFFLLIFVPRGRVTLW